MDCCGGGGKSHEHGSEAASENGGGMSWTQALAVGLVLMFLLGILLTAVLWH